MEHDQTPGLDRRDLLKRGAVVGGALVWTTPLVQTVASPAFAVGSPTGQEEPGCTTTELRTFKYDPGTNNLSDDQTEGGGSGCRTSADPAQAHINKAAIAGLTVTVLEDNPNGPAGVDNDGIITINMPVGTSLVGYNVKIGNQCFSASPDVTVVTSADGRTVTIIESVPNGISHVSLTFRTCA